MNIFLIGYFGFGNLGDELLLNQFVSFLKYYFPQLNISVLGKPSVLTQSAQVRWIFRKSWIHFLIEWFRSDWIIFSGGGLWQTQSGKGLTAWVYYLLAKLAELFGKKIIFFNQGIEGLQNRFLEKRLLRLFERASFSFLRETSQISILNLLNVKKNKIKVMPDALFLKSKDSEENQIQTVDKMGICLTSDISKPLLKDLLGALQEQKKYRLIEVYNFFPLQDTDVSEQVFKVLDSFHTVKLFEGPDILKYLPNCRQLIGMRYHSLVLAAKYRIPFLGIFKQMKSQRLAEILGYPYLNAAALTVKDQDAWNQLMNGGKINLEKINRVEEQVGVAWKALYRYLSQELS